MLSKRSQIQMGESIAVVIIVIILLVIGIALWRNSQASDIRSSQIESQDSALIDMAKTASELPELRCYSTEDVKQVNCYDWYKLLALNESMHNSTTRPETFRFYNNYFGKSRITFQKVYPEPEENLTIYDNNISANKALRISIPIVLSYGISRSDSDIKAFGMIIVEGYYN